MMRTELDEIMQWYEISLDAQKVMKRLVKKNSKFIPLCSTLVTMENLLLL